MSRLLMLLALVVVSSTTASAQVRSQPADPILVPVNLERLDLEQSSLEFARSELGYGAMVGQPSEPWATEQVMNMNSQSSWGTPPKLAKLLEMPDQLPDLDFPHITRCAYAQQTMSGRSPSARSGAGGGRVGRGGAGGGESGGGGAGAAAATDPSVPLTQLQLQNIFTPSTYDASGYSNTFIVQPVLPFNIGEDAFFPYHIMRPTIPIIAPTADPDGARGVHGGLGDTTVVDAFIHPIKKLKTNVGFGYVATLPTRTHPALGRGEWQLGPSFALISRAIPKWITGGLVEVPFSLESDAYSVQMQMIALRLLPNEWFIGWGDQILKFDDQNGGYDIPLSMQVGKVAEIGGTPMKLFVQPIYTPDGLRSGPGGTEWAIKLNLTILFPEAKFDAPLLSGCGGHSRRNCCR